MANEIENNDKDNKTAAAESPKDEIEAITTPVNEQTGVEAPENKPELDAEKPADDTKNNTVVLNNAGENSETENNAPTDEPRTEGEALTDEKKTGDELPVDKSKTGTETIVEESEIIDKPIEDKKAEAVDKPPNNKPPADKPPVDKSKKAINTAISEFGNRSVSVLGVIVVSLFLVSLIISIFWFIQGNLPKCYEEAAANVNGNTNNSQAANPSNRNEGNGSNQNVGSNLNTASNAANQNANVNQNAGVNPSGNPATNPNPPANSETNTGTSSSPVKIVSISPNAGRVSGGTLVTITGTGFGKDPTVVFGGTKMKIIVPSSNESITVETINHSPEKVDVVVRNSAGESDILTSAYTYSCPPMPNRDMFWLVILAGALGGSIHSLRSLWWYVGNRDLLWSWVLMYILLPFIGAAIAAVFYMIFQGGFFSTTSVTTDSSLALIAIAALVGLFSQQAILKLQDIANAVLTKPGPGDDSRPQTTESVGSNAGTETNAAPTGIKMEPLSGKIGGGDVVTISGVPNFKSLTFDGESIDHNFDANTSTVTFTTPEHESGEVAVLVDFGGKEPFKLTFTYAE